MGEKDRMIQSEDRCSKVGDKRKGNGLVWPLESYALGKWLLSMVGELGRGWVGHGVNLVSCFERNWNHGKPLKDLSRRMVGSGLHSKKSFGRRLETQL